MTITFSEAILQLLEIKQEVPMHTLIILGRLSGLSEREAKAIIEKMLEYGDIYVARQEKIIKKTKEGFP